MTEPFTFERSGRSSAAMLSVAAAMMILILLRIVFVAAWWLLAILLIPVLPAIRDLIVDAPASLSLDDERLIWTTGNRTGMLELAEIDHMRFDRRWDFSVRVTAVLKAHEKRVHLPEECLPRRDVLAQAFEARGMEIRRNPFSVL
ncbi:hypothetical protein [Chachezhania antarctica]|uniref:hypothetical protein n=1 Tax=Chachezhania antarctica TaxID=2340860 RepID=UPI000EABEEBD|nr:hypothetical protein [Chachezhania antarctica]|tara:strand:+ start:3466 stop:3900 length:435 start_codon:yes stop_codon:yes gene_type:complete